MTKYQKAKDAAGRVRQTQLKPVAYYPGTSIEVLTPREVEVLGALASGMTAPQIAAAQFTTRRTVEFHLHNLYLKMGTHNRQSAVRRAVELGIIACPFCTPPPVPAAD